MSRTFAGVLAGLLILGAVGAASAGIPSPDYSQVALSTGGLTTCPSGDGPAFHDITVTAKNATQNPIADIPYSSFFFTVVGGNVTITHVDDVTDPSGEIRFSVVGDETIILLPPNGLTITCQIYTVVLNDSDTLPCNSYDINNDDAVGVQDAQAFVTDYGTTAARSDFNWDGSVGVQDAQQFVTHYGH
jgi:hypothetical protein